MPLSSWISWKFNCTINTVQTFFLDIVEAISTFLIILSPNFAKEVRIHERMITDEFRAQQNAEAVSVADEESEAAAAALADINQQQQEDVLQSTTLEATETGITEEFARNGAGGDEGDTTGHADNSRAKKRR